MPSVENEHNAPVPEEPLTPEQEKARADIEADIKFLQDSNGVYSAFIYNLKANYTVELLTATDHNLVSVEWVQGSFDIGGFDFFQGSDTPDVDLEFSVAIQDKDADLMHYGTINDVYDDFKIKVDGTGLNNDPNNIAPTAFATSYDTFI